MSVIDDEVVRSELSIMLHDIGIAKTRVASHEHQAEQWRRVDQICSDHLAQAMSDLGVHRYTNDHLMVTMIDGRAVVTFLQEDDENARSLN